MGAVTIPWGPFSPKHRDYIRGAMGKRMCVAEGAIRSGKTIDHCIVAAAYLEHAPDRFHLASGSTVANAKLNIGVCNGFGLESLFRGRCKWGKYRDNDALFIGAAAGERIVIFAGGGRADSYRHILGNSYGLWIATEVNEHYDCADSRTSFIKVAMGRQLAAVKPMTLWDLNPCPPRAAIYREYIDRYRETGLAGGYLYQHFTIRDNATVSPRRLKEIESRYDADSVWYRRDILGQRVAAEGLVYRQFADAPGRYTVDAPPGRVVRAAIGVDFGGGNSAHAFCCVGFVRPDGGGGEIAVVLDEYREPKALTPSGLEEAFVDFVKRCQGRWLVTDAWCDSAEQTLINGLRAACGRHRVPINVGNALKKNINERIRATCALIGSGRFFVRRGCDETIDALCAARWDPDQPDRDVRLDDGSTNIDSLDAMEYALERDMTGMLEAWG